MEKELLQEYIKGRVAMSIYANFIEASAEMPADEARDFIYHVVRYGLSGEIPNLEGKSPLFRVAWKMCVPKLDRDLTKYHNGKKGGAPEGNTNRKGTTINRESTENQPRINREST